jgi:hypothetical protein
MRCQSGAGNQAVVQLLERGRAGTPALLQRVTKVTRPGKRVSVPLELLPDDEIEALVENPGLFVLELDNETRKEFLQRAERKLRQRKQVTTATFNVRSRAVNAVGIVLSEDSYVLDLAEKKGDIHVATLDKEKAAREEFRELNDGTWGKILDQTMRTPQGGSYRTVFYGRAELAQRGSKENAAAPRENATLPHPPDADVVRSRLTVSGPCRRGASSPGRDAAMGNLSALNYARAVGVGGAEGATWEWLHLVGSSLGGGNTRGNLVAGTFDANTLMIPIEQAVVEYSNRPDVTREKPMQIEVTAAMLTVNGSRTWVAERITVAVHHKGTKRFSLGPIEALRIAPLTRAEYDFYSYVFRKMAGNA